MFFEDFDTQELKEILSKSIERYKWCLKDQSLLDVCARRLASGRGAKGFANARTVRKLIETAYQRALDRGAQDSRVFVVEDFLGDPPDEEHSKALSLALRELEKRKGMHQIKSEIYKLVKNAKTNYDRELRGEKPIGNSRPFCTLLLSLNSLLFTSEMMLNRLFIGNPGTGIKVCCFSLNKSLFSSRMTNSSRR